MLQRFLLLLLVSLAVTACSETVTTPQGTNPPAPTLELTNPSSGSTTTDQSFIVSGTATASAGATLSSLYYTHNGSSQTLALPSDGSFSFTVTLVSGYNIIQVTARDNKGKEAKSDITVTYTDPGNPNNPNPNPTGSFDLSPSYPSGNTAYFIAQNAEALYKVKISRLNGFATLAQNFDSVTITGSVIGSGSSKVYAIFRKDLSSGDDLAFTLTGGAAAPVGSYTITLTATSGSLTKTMTANLNVTECSFGCN